MKVFVSHSKEETKGFFNVVLLNVHNGLMIGVNSQEEKNFVLTCLKNMGKKAKVVIEECDF
ncbi:MAG: hypothetical protein KKA64_02725 [Nanoarchaeota archaeon]|nr:hypothetical protein [Nanoarchaeota archaeon]